MSVFGVDYAWGRPSVTALKKAGVKFVCRYLSHDTTGKNLTRSEAEKLSDAGLWIVVVWETTAKRALSGRSGGKADAEDAARMARALGMPADRPIYFAVDWDATASDQAAINAYLDGAASVIGRARVGIYAGYWPVKRSLDGKHATWAWQTYAWSGGRWDKRAPLQQYSNDHTIGGVDCDYDRGVKDDYGQWRVGVSPNPPNDPEPPSEEEPVRYYGQLNNGPGAVTPISLHPGDVGAIGFICDNGIAEKPPVKLRVAVHDKQGWYAREIEVDSAKPKAWFDFRDSKTTDGVSIVREDDGSVPVAWDAS
jgi:hypothetical protein